MKRANGFRVAADSLHPAYALVDNIVINRRVLATLALELLSEPLSGQELGQVHHHPWRWDRLLFKAWRVTLADDTVDRLLFKA